MKTTRCMLLAAMAVLLLPASSWAARVTGARLDQLDLFEDASLARSRTVEASELGFPLEIEDSNAKAVKIRYQGRSYWVIRALVDTEGLESATRKESVNTHDVGATRGLGK
jgi:hypothetical protein